MTKILLVEDDKSLREIYGVRLLAEGYDIVSAGDGEEALAMAIKDRPALIVSDVMMPKISGFDMLDILRSTTETRDIKVIMMTALSSEDQRLRGQQLGADRYLVKSQVGIEDVVRTVHEVLEDAPVTAAATPNPFVQTPTAVARPSAPVQAPSRDTVTSPAARPAPSPFVAPTPTAPVYNPEPSAAQTQPPQPQTPSYQPVNNIPSAPSPTLAPPSAPQSSELPRPTAPFSTPRPNNLASRVIEPLSNSEDDSSKPPVSDLIANELSQATPSTATPTTTVDAPSTSTPGSTSSDSTMTPLVTPQPPVSDPSTTTSSTPTTFQDVQPPTSQQSPSALTSAPTPPVSQPSNPFLSSQPTTPTQQSGGSGLQFEETPRA